MQSFAFDSSAVACHTRTQLIAGRLYSNVKSNHRKPNVRAYSQSETAWTQLREILGHTGGDPGHWNFSPEWYGTQDKGWGKDAGQIVFNKQSEYNGTVTVTAHSASLDGFDSRTDNSHGSAVRQEWRVLRFNDFTRQSVSRVNIIDDALAGDQQQRWWLESGQRIAAMPECLGQEYLKTQVSIFAALLGLLGLINGDKLGLVFPAPISTTNGTTNTSSSTTQLTEQAFGERPLRVLCIGLGGGSLPMFLADRFPYAEIDAVEIDPVVVEAALGPMGMPSEIPCLSIHTIDAVEYVKQHAAAQRPVFDVVCLDAFDGDDQVPGVLCEEGFAKVLARVMHPQHGILVANFHSLEIRAIAAVFKKALLLGDSNSNASARSGCFSVSTQKQTNVAVVCARGLDLPSNVVVAKEKLRLAAAFVADKASYPFPAGSRASRNFSTL